MAIINSVITWIIKKRIHQIDLFMKYPHDVQEEWFKKLLHAGKETEFGKKYDFDSIRNYEQYRERIPVHSYASLKPYIDRLRSGEQDVLWPSDIKWFAKSSGTTAGKSKYRSHTCYSQQLDKLNHCILRGGKLISILKSSFG